MTSNRPHVREGWSSETQISQYVLPGKKVEFFDPRNSRKFLVVFKRYQFPADHPVFKSMIQKLAGALTDMANQWNIKFLFRASPASSLRITSLRDVIRNAQHIVGSATREVLLQVPEPTRYPSSNDMLSVPDYISERSDPKGRSRRGSKQKFDVPLVCHVGQNPC